jgi:hypothetical protein
VTDELERMYKDVAVAYFEVLSQHLPGKSSKRSGLTYLLGQDLNPVYEYTVEIPPFL